MVVHKDAQSKDKNSGVLMLLPPAVRTVEHIVTAITLTAAHILELQRNA
jgi:hypothetical protein